MGNLRQGMVSIFLAQLLKQDRVIVKGPLDRFRDFVYIDDLVDQIILMTESKIHGEVFNCGFGKNYSINEMLKLVQKIFNKTGNFKVIDPQYEPTQTLADITKSMQMLRWKPVIDLEEGYNLVSLPLSTVIVDYDNNILYDSSIETLIQDIADNVEAIYYYNQGYWQEYIPDDNSELQYLF